MTGRLIGMVHLGPLPGAPEWSGDLAAIVDRAVADARLLADSGFDAVLIENFGDAPFYADSVPPATVAGITRAAAAVADAVDVPIGINVLRNDALAAVSIGVAVEAAFVRVNVLSGTMVTDQGPITGRAAEVARLRASLGAGLEVYADVMVKHAVPPPGLTLAEAARDLWSRGGADALIVSGRATGAAVDPADLEAVRRAAPGAPLLIGSGATPETVAGLLEDADGVIVGTALKVDGTTTGPVDPDRAAAFVSAAGG